MGLGRFIEGPVSHERPSPKGARLHARLGTPRQAGYLGDISAP